MNAQTILISRRAVSQGGTLAKDIEPGDIVNTPTIGPLMVGEASTFKSEGDDMVCLVFPGFPGFPSYKAIMPTSCDVDVKRS
jgi:hypothetical protein